MNYLKDSMFSESVLYLQLEVLVDGCFGVCVSVSANQVKSQCFE